MGQQATSNWNILRYSCLHNIKLLIRDNPFYHVDSAGRGEVHSDHWECSNGGSDD